MGIRDFLKFGKKDTVTPHPDAHGAPGSAAVGQPTITKHINFIAPGSPVSAYCIDRHGSNYDSIPFDDSRFISLEDGTVVKVYDFIANPNDPAGKDPTDDELAKFPNGVKNTQRFFVFEDSQGNLSFNIATGQKIPNTDGVCVLIRDTGDVIADESNSPTTVCKVYPCAKNSDGSGYFIVVADAGARICMAAEAISKGNRGEYSTYVLNTTGSSRYVEKVDEPKGDLNKRLLSEMTPKERKDALRATRHEVAVEQKRRDKLIKQGIDPDSLPVGTNGAPQPPRTVLLMQQNQPQGTGINFIDPKYVECVMLMPDPNDSTKFIQNPLTSNNGTIFRSPGLTLQAFDVPGNHVPANATPLPGKNQISSGYLNLQGNKLILNIGGPASDVLPTSQGVLFLVGLFTKPIEYFTTDSDKIIKLGEVTFEGKCYSLFFAKSGARFVADDLEDPHAQGAVYEVDHQTIVMRNIPLPLPAALTKRVG